MPNQTTRRTFLKLTTAAASVTAIEFSHAVPTGNAIALIVDPGLALTTSEPVEWAAEQFRQALTDKGIRSSTTGSSFTVIVSPVIGPLAKAFGNLPSITRPETTALIPGTHNNAQPFSSPAMTHLDSSTVSLNLLSEYV